MSLTPFYSLPELETEPFPDWSYVCQNTNGQASLLLVYATKRDFLSVPKTYAVVEFRDSEEIPLELHSMAIEEYLEDTELEIEEETAGIFELDAADDYQIILLLNNITALEIACASFTLHQEIYHTANSRVALAQYLSSC
ncbi:hypothetical protein [Amphritea sp. HPY]|uniref:hypothetical protein n=1 Tax=Amphritea sp. HPY TaxID=3421652 RepID=UPI003D7E48BD